MHGRRNNFCTWSSFCTWPSEQFLCIEQFLYMAAGARFVHIAIFVHEHRNNFCTWSNFCAWPPEQFLCMNPSCALPQALSSWEQAHAGEGRVLSDVVGASWYLGNPARRACLLWFFLASLTGIKSHGANSGRTNRGLQKQFTPIEKNVLCGFESLKTPPADDQLWQIQNAQNSSYVPPNIGPPPGAAGARFPGGRVPKKLKHVETFLKQRSSSFEWTWSGGLIPPGLAAMRQNTW